MTSYEENIKTELKKNDELLNKKLTELADLQYEVELIKEHGLNIVKGIYDSIQGYNLHQIWSDFDHDKHTFKPDGGSSRNRLKYIEMAFLFENGRPKDIKLKNIVMYGYAFELWLIYTKGEEEFAITLPVFKTADKENYKQLSYRIMSVHECTYNVVFVTQFLSELKDGVAKFLNGEIGNE